jgi:TnpA family transposase
MPRRSILSAAERAEIYAPPDSAEEMTTRYEFNAQDLAVIRSHRGSQNRLGFAVQLAYMRFPGVMLAVDEEPADTVLEMVAAQLNIGPGVWADYGARAETRREHLVELEQLYGYRVFTTDDIQMAVAGLGEVAWQTDKGIVLGQVLAETLRGQRILLPSPPVLERVCAEAVTRSNRRIYETLTKDLTEQHRSQLDELFERKDGGMLTWLAWLRLPPGKPNSRHVLEHIDRLDKLRSLSLPHGVERLVHQNRLLKIAREGAQMTATDLAKFETQRRYATMVALVVESVATVTDEIIDLHDRVIIRLMALAKAKHQEQFHKSGKAVNDSVKLFGVIGRALVDAKAQGTDPFAAIEAIIGWDAFSASVSEAEILAQPTFDYLRLLGDTYATVRRYAPRMLEVLELKAAPTAQDVIDGVNVLRPMNRENLRKVPADAPTSFVKDRWEKLVHDGDSLDRRFYELCVMSELKNRLRSGDVSVVGSRQFKDFDDYLIPAATFNIMKTERRLPVSIDTDCETYLTERIGLLEEQLATVNRLASTNELTDVVIDGKGLKVSAHDTVVPDDAQVLIDRTAALLPHLKITELLVEVEQWTGFSRHFTHLKTGAGVKDKAMLLTTILADGINLGLTKMAESCPGTTYAKLARLQAWHIRDETYAAALAELVNAQHQEPFAAHWGDGTTSSSDGQRFRAGGRAESTGHVNPKYGTEPGRTIYTHISDKYAPFHSKVVNVGVRDSTYVLDGLLYHESDIRIAEHYTDTNGFTDHVFGLMHLLGFRFAPRIRDLADTRIYTPNRDGNDILKPLIGGTLNLKHLRAHWDELMRLAASIKQGTVTASLMLRKLGSYPRQNGLAIAAREFGRIERTLFILDWLQNPDLRRRSTAGLNKGEARHALAKAVFFYRLGEFRDRTFEQQRYRASGLNLLTAAIVLWNTVYLERATRAIDAHKPIDRNLLQHLSPLGWEHINLTGDYTWKTRRNANTNKYRPLRPFPNP